MERKHDDLKPGVCVVKRNSKNFNKGQFIGNYKKKKN